jgi:hypothetical protein
MHVLFVGNSITYTNNLPAIYEALVGDRIKASMFVKGGARLADELNDARLVQVIRNGGYGTIVVQEQGGLVLCTIMPDMRSSPQCRASRQAHLQIAQLAKASGARVFYLGTYQTDPAMSHRLVRVEARLAKEMGAGYIEVSDTLVALAKRNPSRAWYHEGDLHPGPMLTALMAVKLYEGMYGVNPLAKNLCTTNLLFGPKDKLDGLVQLGTVSRSEMASNCIVSANDVAWIIKRIGKARR